MTCSILIPQAIEAATMKRLARLASKAGVQVATVPGVTVVYRMRAKRIVSKYSGETWLAHEVDTTQALACSRITVGDMPRFNGYTLAGRISHTAEGNMLALAPTFHGVAIPQEWRDAKPTCDHCNTLRSRKDTFLVQGPDGKLQRVGRNCLADFLKSSPEQLIALSVFQDSLRDISAAWDDDGESTGHWCNMSPTPLHLLACAFSALERSNGVYIKTNPDHDPIMGGEQSTRETAMFLADRRNRDRGHPTMQAAWKEGQPKPEHWSDVVGAMLWLESETSGKATSDYIHNLCVAMMQPVTDRRTTGLVASVTAAYRRAENERALKSAATATPRKDAHVGALKERLDLQVTILGVHGYVGTFGASHIVRMLTDDGCEVVCFTAGDCPIDGTGKRMSVRGTVKSHDVRKGVKQTVLSRCVWSE